MTSPMERRIRWSGVLIFVGLVLQMLTLPWTHPLGFVGFIMAGCPLVGAGMLLFLYSLVSHDKMSKPDRPADVG